MSSSKSSGGSNSGGGRIKGHVLRRRKTREAQPIELVKQTVFLRGHATSQYVVEAMKDLRKLKRGSDHKLLTRNNEFLPMEDPSGLEQLCTREDCGAFVMVNDTKKRPHNVVLGRLFDGRLLDAVEFGVSQMETIDEVLKRTQNTAGSDQGPPPLMLFRGEGFANAAEGSPLATLQSLLLDVYRGAPEAELDLEALDLVIVFTSFLDEETKKQKVSMRTYRVTFDGVLDEATAPSGGLLPKVKLVEHGPHLQMELRRTHVAAPNLAKLARKQLKTKASSAKRKNVTNDKWIGKTGRVHMKVQDTSKLVTRSRFGKAFKRSPSEEGEDASRKPAAKRVKRSVN